MTKGGIAALVALALATCALTLVREPGPTECTDTASATAPRADTTGELRLRLNVPAYRLDVIEHGSVTRAIRVAVGQPRYRTPIGSFRVDFVVWNPWWRPPDSYWARKERPQAPGWSNPVGRVKLHVTGLVFMHGTPLEQSLGSAASHACVRMSNADATLLARTAHTHAGPALSSATLDSLDADTTLTRTIALTRSIPIDIEYRLAEVAGGALHLYPDVYRRSGGSLAAIEGAAIVALLAAGSDTSLLRIDRLRELARASRRAAVSLPIDSLVARTAIASDDAP